MVIGILLIMPRIRPSITALASRSVDSQSSLTIGRASVGICNSSSDCTSTEIRWQRWPPQLPWCPAQAAVGQIPLSARWFRAIHLRFAFVFSFILFSFLSFRSLEQLGLVILCDYFSFFIGLINVVAFPAIFVQGACP